MSSYTVKHVEHGMIITGPVPFQDLAALMNLAESKGWDIADASVSGHLDGVSMAFSNKEHSKLWRAELGLS